MRVEELGDPLRHVEARALIVEPDHLVAEGLIGERRPFGVDVGAKTASRCV